MIKLHRCFSLAVFLLVGTFVQVQAGEWIDKVYVRYEPAKTFKRISEYFTGVENPGNRLIVRQPEEARAGMYWVLRLHQPVNQLPEGAQLRLSFIREEGKAAETRLYTLENERKVSTIFAGVTGEDWSANEPVPLAWKLECLDADGRLLDARQSFLWEYPKP